AVDRIPHFHGQRSAHGAGIGAGDFKAIADRGRVGGGEGEKVGDVLFVGFAVMGKKSAGTSRGRDRGFPFIAAAAIGDRKRGQALRRFENAGEVFRALDVTGKPVEIIGGAGQHRQESRTQVSLVPPPWLELTTSEPFFSATRVRPPGTMRMRSRPVST